MRDNDFINTPLVKIKLPENSEWKCHLFHEPSDASGGIIWQPKKGKEPNAWVRFWMRVFFGCHWVKTK